MKKIKPICKNCKLFDPKNSECSIVILHEGEKVKIPVDVEDSCFFEQPYFDPTTKAMEDFADEIKEVKLWVEDEQGQKINGLKENGVVKMQYPEGFFGEGLDEIYPDDSEEFKDFFKKMFPDEDQSSSEGP